MLGDPFIRDLLKRRVDVRSDLQIQFFRIRAAAIVISVICFIILDFASLVGAVVVLTVAGGGLIAVVIIVRVRRSPFLGRLEGVLGIRIVVLIEKPGNLLFFIIRPKC